MSSKCRFVKRRIPRDCKFLAHLHLVKLYFYWLFDVICCLHFVSILYQVFGSYLAASNADPVHQFDKQRFGIYHHHILCSNVVHMYEHTKKKK